MLENRGRLVYHMFHVSLRVLELLVSDHLLHPARIEVDEVTRATPDIREVLDGQAEAARAGRAHHQPVMIAWKMLVGNLFRELTVINLVILPADALLGHAGG